MRLLTFLNCKKTRVLCQAEIVNAFSNMAKLIFFDKAKVSEYSDSLYGKPDSRKFLQKGFREKQALQSKEVYGHMYLRPKFGT